MRFAAPRKLFRSTLSLFLACEMVFIYIPVAPMAASTSRGSVSPDGPVGLAAVVSQGVAWLLSQLGPSGDDAEFVSQEVPDLMLLTLNYSVVVTMRNTGTRTWRRGNTYTLNSLTGATWGTTRVDTADDIEPGQVARFQFGIRAPSSEGFYNFQWQMQRVGQWFGSPSANVAVQVIPQGPLPPRDLRVTAVSRREVDLRWTPRSTDEDGFYLERKIGQFGAWLPLDNVGPRVTIYADRTVQPSTTYYYRVRAFYLDGRGRSPFSNETSVTTNSAAPPVGENTIVGTETINGSAMARTAGAAAVTPDGAATYSIPLWVPPGRAGIQPSLSLTYSSHQGNGPLGVGWSLTGLSQISRCRKTWAQDSEAKDIQFTTDDRFCLDDQRLIAVSGAYGADGTEYRTEVDTFVKVVSLNSDGEGPLYFKVFSKDGRILTYGAPPGDTETMSTLDGNRWSVTVGAGERGYVTDLSQHVRLSWSLSRVEDRAGNFLRIYYFKNGDVRTGYEQGPRRIMYTGFGASTGSRFIDLGYLPRPDKSFAFRSGFKTKSTSRLADILAFGPSNPPRGDWLHSYRLSYQDLNPATGRSLLHELKECDQGAVCARSTIFNWTQNDDQFDVVPISLDGWGLGWASLAAGDLDGDGRDDIIWEHQVGQEYYEFRYALSTGTDFTLGPAADFPRSEPIGCASERRGHLRLIDVNNDSRADLIERERTGCRPSRSFTKIFLWNSNDGRFNGGGTITGVEGEPAGIRTYIADMNGDGRPDWQEAEFYRLNTGSDFGPYQYIQPPVHFGVSGLAANINHSGQQAVMLDQQPLTKAVTVNGDGSTDVTLTTAGNLDEYDPNFSRVMVDVNGDGLVDVFIPCTRWVSLNTGNGFAPPEIWPTETPAYLQCLEPQTGLVLEWDTSGRQATVYGGGTSSYVLMPTWNNTFRVIEMANEQGFQPLDVNGDGLTDLLVNTTGQPYLRIRRGPKPDLLRLVTDGFGRWDAFEYRPLVYRNVYTPATFSPPVYPQHAVATSTWVVWEHSFDDGVGFGRVMQYSYEDGREDLRGRGFLGFAKQTVNDIRTGAVVTTQYDNSTQTGTLYLHARVPSRIVSSVSEGPSAWTSEQTFQYTVKNGAHGQPFLYASRAHSDASERIAPGDFVLFGSRTALQTQDAYGNATGTETQVDVIQNGIRTGQVYRSAISDQYDNTELSWLIGLRRRSQATSTLPSGRSQTRTTEFDYFPDTALLKEVRREPQALDTRPELYLQTVFERDAYGLAWAVEERGSGETRREEVHFQEPEHQFPISSTNSAGHVTLLAFHQGYGLLAALDDANGVRTSNQYDGFGRLRRTVMPDNSDITINYGSDDFDHLRIGRSVNGGSLDAVTYDRFGRALLSGARGFNGDWVYSENVFDNQGRLVQVSNPHFSSETPAVNRYDYDVLGRLTRETRPDASFQRHEYHGLETTDWDFKANESRRLLDDLGRVIKTSHFAPSPRREIATRFEYGPFDVAEAVVDALGNRLSSQYDILGRRTLVDDPDTGTTISQYDAFGQVVQESEADGSQINSGYDSLGRSRFITSSVDGNTTFVWDVNSIGRLASSTSADGIVTNHNYDALGRAQQVSWTIENNPYNFDYTYDGFGRLEEIAYPSALGLPRLRVGYGYNAANYLETAKSVETGLVYWQATQANAFGQLTRQAFGNGLVTQRDYDSNLGLLRRIETTQQGQLRQRLLYGYDNNANVAGRSDDVTGVREVFNADFLNRLDRWDIFSLVAPNASQSFTYNDIGNLLSRRTTLGSGENITYGYGSQAGPHAVTTANYGDRTDTYRYDAKGNQRIGPGRIVDYTSFNLPRTITGGTQQGFKYDASHRRVLKRDLNGDQALYVGDLYEKRTSQGQVTHVFYIQAGESPVAQVQRLEQNGVTMAESTQYFHPDNLGTVDTVTDESGAVVERRKYEPFGDRRNPENPMERLVPPPSGVHRGFTFHEHDDEFGLINMKGRMYDPRSAHFLTADPLVGSPLFGQAYNRYAYALNNPASLTDPRGFETCPTGTECIEIKRDVPVLTKKLDWPTLNPPEPAPPPPSEERNQPVRLPFLAGPGAQSALAVPTPGPPVGDDQGTRRISTIGTGSTFNSSSSSAPRGIGQPGTWTGLIPLYGSLRSGIDYYQTGHPVLGTVQVLFAVSDVFLAKAAITAVGKLAVVGFIKLSAKELVSEAVPIASRGGLAAARELGQAGELAAGIVKNTTRIESLTGTAAYRIPDVLNHELKIIGEVKNVRSLSYSNQLQDFAGYAGKYGYQFQLWVRPTTELSGPLETAIREGHTMLRLLP